MGLIALDAGVLIAVLDRDDVHHQAARAAIDDARGRGETLIVPVSAYAETLVAPLRTDPSSGDVVDALLDQLPAEVAPATRAIGRRAAELRARHGNRLRLPDALVVATGQVLGAAGVLTTGAGWPDVGIPVEVVGTRPRRA